MRTEALTAPTTAPGRLADWGELVKPRITAMVLVTAAFGAFLAGSGFPEWPLLLAALAGTGLVAGGASAFNQIWERGTDALMLRTADRPLPAGRIGREAASAFAVALSGAGVVLLALGTNALTAGLGVFSLLAYVFVYTPLKRRTSLSTVVGAVPGALPPVMGWTAVTGRLDWGAAALFGILFLWQLPHFLAIAWLCRADYRAAGFPMLSVIDADGRSTGRQAVLYAAALVPVSLLPSALGLVGATYFGGALLLGLAFLGFSVAFSLAPSAPPARRLLLASVLYLPALMAVTVVDAIT